MVMELWQLRNRRRTAAFILLLACYELNRVRVYNRTDCAQRAAGLTVLVSTDGKDSRQVYQHDGTAFQSNNTTQV
jgi:hypothetical protein